MSEQSMILRSMQATILSLPVLAGTAFAQAPAPAQPLTRATDDAQLTWGPCPPFLPAGCAIAVLQGDPALGNFDIFFKVPGKSVIPPHWHTSAERMVLVAGELEVTYEGREALTLKPGTYAYGPAKHHHHGTCLSADPCVLMIAFELPLDAVPVDGAAK